MLLDNDRLHASRSAAPTQLRSLIWISYRGWVCMLRANNGQKLKSVCFQRTPPSPLSSHLSWLTTVYERDLPGSGLKNNALVSKQLNSWGRWCQAQSKKVRNRQHVGVWSQGAVEMAEPAGGAPNAIR